MRAMIKQVYSTKMRRKVYRLDARFNGKRIRRNFLTRADAESVAYKLQHDRTLRRYGIRQVGDSPCLDELIARRCGVITNKRERTRATRVLNSLVSLLPHGIRVDQVTTSDLQRYVEMRIKDGLAPQSVNRELNIISACLHSARTFYSQLEQWLAPRIPRPKKRNQRRERYITEAEQEKILTWLYAAQREGEDPQAVPARKRVGLIFEWALLSAMRHGEIDRLQWQHIDWRNKTVKVIDTKRNKLRYPPLTATMEAILNERGVKRTGFIFTAGGNTQPHFYRILADACRAVSVPYGDEPNGLIMHDCRHTATTNLLRAGIDLSTIQSITGHSDQTMILYYSHPSGETRDRAARALEASAGRKTA